MALLGLTLNRKNPEFTIEDFLFWMPSHTNFMNTSEGQKYFEKLYPIANNKIFKSVWGTDWEYAMSLCIAHYCYIISIDIILLFITYQLEFNFNLLHGIFKGGRCLF